MQSIVKTLLFLLFLSCSTLYGQSPGNALDFDGGNDLVNCPLPTVFDSIASKDITVEAWIFPRTAGFSRVMYAQQSTSSFFNFATSNGNEIYFYVNSGGPTYSARTTTSYPLNQWTHVACRWTAGTQTVEIFYNGVLQPTAAGGGSSTGTSGVMAIGSRPGGAQYFNGQIDELRIWNVARTDCQIASNFNAEYTAPVPNLVAYYEFDEGTAGGNNAMVTALPDQSGFNNNGTLSNFALSGPGSNWVASTAGITAQGGGSGFMTMDSAAVCTGDTFTFPDGSMQVINSQVVQTSLLMSSNMCDSTVVTTVTPVQVPVTQVMDTVCPGTVYTFPDNSTQTISSGPVTYTSLLTSAQGCDSTVISVVSTFAAPITQVSDTVCAGTVYTFPDSTTQTITGIVTYTSLLASAQGCDSTVISVVSPTSVDTSVTVSGMTLTSNAVNATYQWLNCDSGFTPVPNGNTAGFQPSSTGNYAVAVVQNGCADTSSCYFVNTVNVEAGFSLDVRAYPNPTKDELRVVVGNGMQGHMSLLDLQGKLLMRQEIEAGNALVDLKGLPQGVYLLRVWGEEGEKVLRIVKM